MKTTRFLPLILWIILATPVWAAPAAPRIGLVYSRAQYEALKAGNEPLPRYRKALEAAGAEVVPLVVPGPNDDPRALLDSLQGLLLPGGIDVDPALYGQRPSKKLESVDRTLDDWEISLITVFVNTRRPILGICRGEQVLNVALGGTLYQDLPEERGVIHRGPKDAPVTHAIHIDRGSLLYRLLGTDSVVTNSFHHQAVKKLGKDLRETASSSDGVVEGFEAKGLPVLAVQFHPEAMLTQDARFSRIFTWLVEQARIREPVPATR